MLPMDKDNLQKQNSSQSYPNKKVEGARNNRTDGCSSLLPEKNIQNSANTSTGDNAPNKLDVLCCRGLRPAFSAVDRDLWQWYCETLSKQQGIKITQSMVQARARWAFHQAGITNFKASAGWYRRWISRWRKFSLKNDSKSKQIVAKNASIYVNHRSDNIATSEKNSDKHVDTEGNKGIPEKNNSMLQDKTVESSQGRGNVTNGENQIGHPEPTSSVSAAKSICMSDVTCTVETSGKRSGKSGSDCNKPNGCDSNIQTNSTNDSSAMLSTPMLNIVDYLPPEIMHNLQSNSTDKLSYDNLKTNTNPDTLGNVFTSDMDASMDCLYYPASCELSLQNNMLSDCENETLSTLSNFPFELQQNESYSCGTPSETERLKDIVGFISSQNSNSSNLLHNMTFSNVHDSELSASADSDDFVNSIFRDVGLNIEGQEDNSNASTLNAQCDMLTSAVCQDVLAPEVILESRAQTTVENEKKKVENIEPSTKKSKKSGSGSQPRKKGERYLPHFKAKVLAYASSHTLRETAKKFKVNDGTISSWKKEKDWRKQLARNSSSSHSINNGKKKSEVPPVRPVDQQFMTWLRRCREQERDITASELKDKARQLAAQETAENCHWFKLWVSRFDEEFVYQEGVENLKRKQEKHIQYPVEFKLEVAAYAEQHSQIVAARTFSVSRKRVFEWLQILRSKLAKSSTETQIGSCDRIAEVEKEVSKKSSSRRSDLDKEIDEQIWLWYQTQQTKGSKPSWHEVQAKGLELYRGLGNEDIKCSYRWYKRWCDRFHVVLRHEGDDAMLEWVLTQLELGRSLSHNDLQVHALSLASDNTFKASPGWAIRFCKRHPELLQQNPTLDTVLPIPLIQKVEKFRAEVQHTVRDSNLSLSSVGNMDELYLNFSALVSGSSTNAKRQLLVRRSEMENCHATIVLACLADGNLLPPAVILKVNGSEGDTVSQNKDIVVFQQEEGLMDSSCMSQWLESVWFKYVPVPNLLLLDCLEPHVGENVGTEFSNHKSKRLIIPGGCTSKLQPLDISLKATFQASIQKQWSMFNHSNGTWDSAGNKFQLPGCKEIVEWVTTTYQSLQAAEQETVRRSFLVTGLTVAANNSEDHFIDNLSVIPRSSNV